MMLTRCPSCATAFRVSAEQLKVKQGKVRCGQCHQVFNALPSLVDALAPAQAAVESPLPAEERPAVAASAVAEPPRDSQTNSSEEPPAPLYSGGEEPAERPWPSYFEEAYAAPVYGRAGRGQAWLWGGAAFIALLLLSLQALLHFRTELSLSFPEAKSLLRDGSALLGLDLPLPHKGDLLAIETSDLHPGSGAQLVLTATLKNRAAYAQAYPHLELTLTDIGDQALLRRILLPSDYLPTGVDLSAGFPARGELALKLALEVAIAGAAGYRIYVFYP